MPGQVPCVGCGSDAISWGRVSLLTNVTLWPMVMETCCGLTPFAVIVIVAPLGPAEPVDAEITVVPPVGELLPPPHETRRGSCQPRQRPDVSTSGRRTHQKNFLEMLKPRYQLSLVTPPRATCANVVPKLFEKFN